MSEVTDQLLELATRTARKEKDFYTIYYSIEKKHHDLINSLFEEPLLTVVRNHITVVFKDLESVINGVYHLNDLTPKFRIKY